MSIKYVVTKTTIKYHGPSCWLASDNSEAAHMFAVTALRH